VFIVFVIGDLAKVMTFDSLYTQVAPNNRGLIGRDPL
jgi:hypothetical protein